MVQRRSTRFIKHQYSREPVLKKPNDLFALANMLLMCVSHLSVLVNRTPKYGFWSTFSNIWSCM
jgi:hypothetical protein